MNTFTPPTIDWQKVANLVPVIIQDNQTHQVLMLGYMNPEALTQTCKTGQVTFYSRSKKRLWIKGETSGNKLKVVQILADCDQDTVFILADITGPCCHLNQSSCFGKDHTTFSVLGQLEKIIHTRHQERPEHHYTTTLLNQGIQRIAQKVGEEGVELALAAVAGSRQETLYEAADLIYHLLVLLTFKEIKFNEVLTELQSRKTE